MSTIVGRLDVPWTVSRVEVFTRLRMTEVASALLDWDQWPKEIIGLMLEYLSSSDWMRMWFFPNSSPLHNLWWLLRFARDSPSIHVHGRLLELATSDPDTLSQIRLHNRPPIGIHPTCTDAVSDIVSKIHQRWNKRQHAFITRNGYASHDATLHLSPQLTKMVMDRHQYASLTPVLDLLVIQDECNEWALRQMIAGHCMAFLEEIMRKEDATHNPQQQQQQQQQLQSSTRDKYEQEHHMQRWNCITGSAGTVEHQQQQARFLTFLEDIGFLRYGGEIKDWNDGGLQVMQFCLVQCLMRGDIQLIRWMVAEKQWDIQRIICSILRCDLTIWWDSSLRTSMRSWSEELLIGRHPSSVQLLKYLVEDCKFQSLPIITLVQTIQQRRQARSFVKYKRQLPPPPPPPTLTTPTTAIAIEPISIQ